MGEVNDAAIKKTQDMLGKIIKKPPLTEKLLGRPPFRFLHDVMTSVIRGTGFMKGLFNEEEMNSESIKEKDQKIAFLQKVIDIIELATGKKLAAKPSKIVAGLDADKTNELLQALAEAVTKSASNNDDLVKRVLGGNRAGSSKSVAKSKEPEKEASADKSTKKVEKDGSAKEHKPAVEQVTVTKDSHAAAPVGAKDKAEVRKQGAGVHEEKAPAAEQPVPAAKEETRRSRGNEEGRQESSQERRGERERSSDGRRKERTRENDKDKHREPAEEATKPSAPAVPQPAASTAAAAAADGTDGTANDRGLANGNKEDEEPPANRIPRPSSAKGSRRRHREGKRVARESDEEDERGAAEKREDSADAADDGEQASSAMAPATELRKLVRPSSARPAPPRPKKQDGGGSAGLEHSGLQERLDSGKRVANLITENGDKSDDDDTFIVQDGSQDLISAEAERNAGHGVQPTATTSTDDGGEHGGLVKKILETRKEFEGKQQQQTSTAKGEAGTTIAEASLRKERELIQREVDKLRASIQTVTRSANPLGKVMDYVQEDVDAMHKELMSWKKENRELALQLRREQSVTDTSVEPLRAQLSELEQTIADRLDLIAAVKHNITRNDEKIDKMLSTISQA